MAARALLRRFASFKSTVDPLASNGRISITRLIPREDETADALRGRLAYQCR